ncbi:MAG: hypothetical protein IPM24_22755 [Bryobacterales bacterium]|jgi:hypothetical protein|nr:hypothetical protein [Bryobacterales bacterium]
MMCAKHPEAPAAAFCRECGMPLCAECRIDARGTVFCQEHAPAGGPDVAGLQAAPHPMPPRVAIPGLAFLLGFIPGIGAIYNAQYAKGLVHVLVFGFLVTILSSGAASGAEPLLGILLGAFVLYMPFEAYHTARRRNLGDTVPEFASLPPALQGSNTTAVVLIALGVLLLMITMDLVSLRIILKYWPALLIALGVNMLYARLRGERAHQEEEINQ